MSRFVFFTYAFSTFLAGCGADERLGAWLSEAGAEPQDSAANADASADATDSADGGDADAGPESGSPAPTACQVAQRWSLASSGSARLFRALRRGSELAVLWTDDEGWQLSLSSIAQPSLVARVALPKEGNWYDITTTPSGYALALGGADGGLSVHSLTTEWSEVSLSDPPISFAVFALTATAAGGLILVWSEKSKANDWYAVKFKRAPPGGSFGATETLSEGGLGTEFEFLPLGNGVALAWVDVQKGQSTLKYVTFDGAGLPLQAAKELTHHNRYVYDVSVARGDRGIGFAFTDSRVDILNTPAYFTALDFQGAKIIEDKRLTFSGEHEPVDLAWVGGAHRYVYRKFLNGPGSQVHLLDLDEQGETLAPPLQVSLASYLEHGSDTRVAAPKIVQDGSGGAVVLWPELVEKSTWALKAARLNCQPK